MAQVQITEVRNKHEAIAQFMAMNPTVPQGIVAAEFNVTQAWLSVIVRSDAFQQRMKELQGDLYSPVMQSLREKMETAAHLALDALTEKLGTCDDAGFALDASDRLLSRMGYGNKNGQGSTVINNNLNVQTVDPNLLKESRALLGQSYKEESVEDVKALPPAGLQVTSDSGN